MEAAGILLNAQTHRIGSRTDDALPAEADDIISSISASSDPWDLVEQELLRKRAYVGKPTHRCIFSDCPRAREENGFVARNSLYDHLRVTHKLTDTELVRYGVSDAVENSFSRESEIHEELCFFNGCNRAQSGRGFQRRRRMFDHMKEVHNYTGTTGM